MAKTRDSKRENFEVNAEQQAALENLAELLDSSSKKEAMLYAVNLTLHLVAEAHKGNQFFVGDAAKNDLKRFVLIGVEKPDLSRWLYLSQRPHPWRKQLYVKGRKLPASAVWSTMQANKMSVAEAAENWELPVEAIDEIVDYCQQNKSLLILEAEEELRIMEEQGDTKTSWS